MKSDGQLAGVRLGFSTNDDSSVTHHHVLSVESELSIGTLIFPL
eukprot:CAMPEP_0115031672 /NCGR_PEP_ID=MMETSP0216-20121206/38681_1 /TAXON_ID=223996 /ORGANISM="Protocruzia adherens, Strain Boccale" /LENGTH=43 /DNA_ID= /DNA_START= /DNA_END= /DNA_ORIENTATION=